MTHAEADVYETQVDLIAGVYAWRSFVCCEWESSDQVTGVARFRILISNRDILGAGSYQPWGGNKTAWRACPRPWGGNKTT